MRCQIEVSSGNGEIGCDGKLFASAGPQQGTVIPDSQPDLSA
jgi:hypothetical protein